MEYIKDFFQLKYEKQMNIIKQLVLSNDKSFGKTTDFILRNIELHETKKYDLFDLYLKIINDLYDQKSDIFYKDGNPIFESKQDLMLYVIFMKIKETVKNNNQQHFFDNYLNNLKNFGIDSFNLIRGNEKEGYNFDFLLYIPLNMKNNTLIVEGNNAKVNNSGGELKNPIYISETLEILGSFQYLLDLEAPIFVPLIPNNNPNIKTGANGVYERYGRQLSRNSVNPNINTNNSVKSEDDYIYRTDIQIINAIEKAKKVVFKKTSIVLKEKSLLYGFSTSGNLAVRLGFLHPKKFCGVIAGGINSAIPVPIEEFNSKKLIYPVGISDYKEITGENFNYEEYVKLPQFYFMGELESQDSYNTVVKPLLHDKEITKVYEALNLDLYERCNLINSIYSNLKITEERIKIYKGFGHTPVPAINEIKNHAKEYIENNLAKNDSYEEGKIRI